MHVLYPLIAVTFYSGKVMEVLLFQNSMPSTQLPCPSCWAFCNMSELRCPWRRRAEPIGSPVSRHLLRFQRYQASIHVLRVQTFPRQRLSSEPMVN